MMALVSSAAVLVGCLLAVIAVRADAATSDGLGRIAYVGETCEPDPNPWIPSLNCSSDTYRVRTDGSGVMTQLTRTPLGQFGDIFPSFSSDGERIAFVGYDEEVNYETGQWERAKNAFVMNAEGGDRVNLTNDPLTTGHTPAYDWTDWFPGGRRIVFSKATRASGYYADLYTINVNTGRVVRLTSGGTHEYAAEVSPDGTKIAYMSNRDGGTGRST
jgi:TolB protein